MPFPCSRAGSTTSYGSGKSCYGGNKLRWRALLISARTMSLPLRTTRGGEGYLVETQLNAVSNACVVTRRREVSHAADRHGDVSSRAPRRLRSRGEHDPGE